MTNEAIGYVRVSTSDQAESPAVQEKQIREYCKFKGLEIKKIVADLAVSGGTPLNERPNGKKLSEIRSGSIVVSHLDRLFRSALDCLSTVRMWKEHGVSLHILDLNIDTSTPMGEMLLTMSAAFAQMERRLISERITDVLHHLRSKGRRTGSIPYGRDLAPDGKNLVVNEYEVEVIRWMIACRAKGARYLRIAEKLTKCGVATKRGGKSWDAGRVKSILEGYVAQGLVETRVKQERA